MADFELSIIRLYEDVFHHRCHAFPPYFFVGEEGKRCAGIITRYVLEEKQQWTREDICSYLDHQVFSEYRLAGMLKTYFDHSIFRVINNTYPGEFHPWELVKARRFVFSGEAGRETAKQAVRWMIFDKLNYMPRDFYKITSRIFADYRLDVLLFNMYHGSPWEAIQDAGLDYYQPWEIRQTPNGYWKGESGRIHAITATKWLIEKKLKLPLEDIPSKLLFAQFKQSGLESMLKGIFSGSPYEAVKAAYPGIFKKWQFSSVGNGYWNGPEGLPHAKEAMEWLLFEKLNLTYDEIPYQIGGKTFRQYGLDNMFKQVFHGSVSKALDIIYPGKFTTKILQQAKRSTWLTRESAIRHQESYNKI